uniref:YqaJ viral recombinase domain-containing protein n=1 Tax=viral metagenome TaxID=1070528 RepID=A0A6C0BTP6_9ZZZZ
MIIPSEINEYVSNYVSNYVNESSVSKKYAYRVIENSPLIRNKIVSELILKYNLQDSILDDSSIYYLNQFVKHTITSIVRQYFDHEYNKMNILYKLEKLKKLELPEQRTPEWYKMRETMLTASSLADALGKGHFKTKEDLLIDKSSKDPLPYFSNDIIEWGVKYEPVATTFYEKINNVNVLEFGLVPHPEFKIFGASPDGICDENSSEEYIGRMLEIKCPPVRKFTKEVPEHYWMQMQGQLETCDLEECDFLQVKLLEYNSEEEYENDKYLENEKVKEGYTEYNLPKGLVLTFISYNDKKEKKYNYEYSKFDQSYDDLKKWSDEIIKNYKNEYSEIKYNWWRIDRYECTLVLRDREWWMETMPKIIDFWEDVEHYRKIGNQSLIDKKLERKNKRKSKQKKKKEEKNTNVIEISKEIQEQINNSYLLDSDSE